MNVEPVVCLSVRKTGSNCSITRTMRENGDLRKRDVRMASEESFDASFATEDIEHETEAGESTPLQDGEIRGDFYAELHPMLTMLRFFGLLPTIRPVVKRLPGRGWSMFFALLSFVFFAVNVGTFGFNLYIIELIRVHHGGILHVITMATLLTGIKPLQNIFNLLSFQLGWKLHLRMLADFRAVDTAFRTNFSVQPNWRRGRLMIFALTFGLGLFAFTGRLMQFVLQGDALGDPGFQDLLNDLISFFVVPMLSVWQLVPLLYFDYLNRLLRFWYKRLDERIRRDFHLREHNMNFYYRHYLLLCKAVFSMGQFLNPFIFFSLAVSVCVLCLTIYFVINADMAIRVEPNMTTLEKINVYFFPLWAGLQIVTAIIYVLCIAMAGLRTNEEARAILGTVLAIAPRDQKDQFEIVCFMHKVQSQHTWGVTVWRAFPVERSLLFTLFGIISTYAVVLLKLQKTHMPPTASPGPCMNG